MFCLPYRRPTSRQLALVFHFNEPGNGSRLGYKEQSSGFPLDEFQHAYIGVRSMDIAPHEVASTQWSN